MSQYELFDHSPVPVNQYGYPIEQAADRLARSGDPETSRSAAKKIACSVTQLAAAAAEMVRKYPGRTGAELDRLAGCEVKRIVSKRLADAADKFGLITRGPKRQCSIGGNEALEGRLWDVLYAFRYAIAVKGDATDRVHFKVGVQQEQGKRESVSLWSLIGPGDEGEPVITIMLEGED